MILREWWMALGFLTTLPVPHVEYDADAFVRAGRWYPLVGLVIGGLLWAAYVLLSMIFPPLVVAVLVVALWAILTGGLHLDGLADCCDGMLAPFEPARRLEIMRDSRVGAFAAIGLPLALLLKTATVAALPAALPALLMAPTWARWLLLPAASQPMARSDGMGSAFAAGLTNSVLGLALVVPIALLLITSPTWQGLIAVVLAHAVCASVCWSARRRLGGVTGDVFGLVVEAGELAILLTYAAAL